MANCKKILCGINLNHIDIINNNNITSTSNITIIKYNITTALGSGFIKRFY